MMIYEFGNPRLCLLRERTRLGYQSRESIRSILSWSKESKAHRRREEKCREGFLYIPRNDEYKKWGDGGVKTV